MTVFFVIFLVSATLSYIVERRAQPDAFGSIPLAMWWTIVTLTTTGYGDVVPVTAWGRLLAGLVMMSGIVTFALWAGIIANAFTEELRRRHFLQTWDLVTRVPFFRNLGAAAIADIVRLLQSQDASPGHIILREGDPGDSMYFIVDGQVAIDVKPHPVKLGPGEFFGEMALIFGAPRSATVVVTRPSILLVLDIADFRVLAGRRPETHGRDRSRRQASSGRQSGGRRRPPPARLALLCQIGSGKWARISALARTSSASRLAGVGVLANGKAGACGTRRAETRPTCRTE